MKAIAYPNTITLLPENHLENEQCRRLGGGTTYGWPLDREGHLKFPWATSSVHCAEVRIPEPATRAQPLSIEDELQGYNSELGELRRKVAALEAANKQNCDAGLGLLKQVEELKADNTRLREVNGSIQAHGAAHLKEMAALEQRNQNQGETIEEQQARIKALTGQIEQLKAESQQVRDLNGLSTDDRMVELKEALATKGVKIADLITERTSHLAILDAIELVATDRISGMLGGKLVQGNGAYKAVKALQERLDNQCKTIVDLRADLEKRKLDKLDQRDKDTRIDVLTQSLESVSRNRDNISSKLLDICKAIGEAHRNTGSGEGNGDPLKLIEDIAANEIAAREELKATVDTLVDVRRELILARRGVSEHEEHIRAARELNRVVHGWMDGLDLPKGIAPDRLRVLIDECSKHRNSRAQAHALLNDALVASSTQTTSGSRGLSLVERIQELIDSRQAARDADAKTRFVMAEEGHAIADLLDEAGITKGNVNDQDSLMTRLKKLAKAYRDRQQTLNEIAEVIGGTTGDSVHLATVVKGELGRLRSGLRDVVIGDTASTRAWCDQLIRAMRSLGIYGLEQIVELPDLGVTYKVMAQPTTRGARLSQPEATPDTP